MDDRSVVSAWLMDRRKSAMCGGALLVSGMVLGALAIWFVDPDTLPAADLPPGDYLYLDDERVDSYLGQLDLGRYSSETRSSVRTRTRQASVDAKGVIQVGATGEDKETVEQVATATSTDRVYRLLKRFGEQFSGKEFRSLDLSSSYPDLVKGAEAADEGHFVRLHRARLMVPAYARVLPRLLYARGLPRRGDPPIAQTTITRLVTQQRGGLNRYLSRLGSDPLIPVVARIPDPRAEDDDGYTVFLPVRYSKLADSPSLISGRVTVVGKVVRQLQPPEDPAREGKYDSLYLDPQVALTYRRALVRMPRPVRGALGIPVERPGRVVGETVTVREPGMVVQPVAIYK